MLFECSIPGFAKLFFRLPKLLYKVTDLLVGLRQNPLVVHWFIPLPVAIQWLTSGQPVVYDCHWSSVVVHWLTTRQPLGGSSSINYTVVTQWTTSGL